MIPYTLKDIGMFPSPTGAWFKREDVEYEQASWRALVEKRTKECDAVIKERDHLSQIVGVQSALIRGADAEAGRVELVARAIHKASGYMGAISWEHLTATQEHYRELARAAIRAMP